MPVDRYVKLPVMSDEQPKKRLLSGFEKILLFLAALILLYFILRGLGMDPVQKSEETEIIDPYKD
mgnify:FL=1